MYRVFKIYKKQRGTEYQNGPARAVAHPCSCIDDIIIIIITPGLMLVCARVVHGRKPNPREYHGVGGGGVSFRQKFTGGFFFSSARSRFSTNPTSSKFVLGNREGEKKFLKSNPVRLTRITEVYAPRVIFNWVIAAATLIRLNDIYIYNRILFRRRRHVMIF